MKAHTQYSSAIGVNRLSDNPHLSDTEQWPRTSVRTAPESLWFKEYQSPGTFFRFGPEGRHDPSRAAPELQRGGRALMNASAVSSAPLAFAIACMSTAVSRPERYGPGGGNN